MSLIDRMHDATKRYTNRTGFQRFIALLIWCNPAALLLQLITVIFAEEVAGVSVAMFMLFIVIQVATALEGIRTKSAPLTYSMIVAMIISIGIVVTVFVKT